MNIILLQLNFLWKIIYENIFRSIHKTFLRLITGKCEIERALNSQNISKFENSILNSNKLMKSQGILAKKNLNQEQINTICEEIITIKGLKNNEKNQLNLQYGLTSLQNLYNSIEILENIRKTPVSISQHSSKLIKLFKDLTGEANLPQNLITNKWIEIGFQGENPTTDFRAGGLLALENLLYFSTNHTFQAQFCLKNSKERDTQYFFAVCGIYITKFLTDCMKMDYLNAYFYKCDDQQKSLKLQLRTQYYKTKSSLQRYWDSRIESMKLKKLLALVNDIQQSACLLLINVRQLQKIYMKQLTVDDISQIQVNYYCQFIFY
ncbi:hypothetical protein ABPG73_004812 [Tetrahymena malaccensis]